MSQNSESVDIEGKQVSIRIDASKLQDIEPVYANLVQLVATSNEIIINFGRIDPPMADSESLDADSPVTITAKPVMRVVLPHSIFDSFAEIVAQQHKRFVQQFLHRSSGNG